MEFKRITLLCGHYGSGKTNVAVNMALKLKEQHNNVAIADLDIVNPYFRSKDSEQDFLIKIRMLNELQKEELYEHIDKMLTKEEK